MSQYFHIPTETKNLANQEDDYRDLNRTQYAIITEMQARFLEMTSKYQEEEERRQRRGYVEEDPADSGSYHHHHHRCYHHNHHHRQTQAIIISIT